MAYTPDEQRLEPSLKKILEGIKEFGDAARARAESGEYNHAHIAELFEVRENLQKFEQQLLLLRKNNY